MTIDIAKLRQLLEAVDHAEAELYAHRSPETREALGRATYELETAAVNALPELLRIAEAATDAERRIANMLLMLVEVGGEPVERAIYVVWKRLGRPVPVDGGR